ncbi:MAG: dihydroorotate dehydrogenase electron transfer subunit [Caldilineales bacterium]|nr:dihydroorotate dehydrogenase electron transfer subunit [Caldilineales bacterium]
MSSLPTPARIVAIVQENARTKTFVFDARWQAEPGQFLMAWLPRFDEKPFSLVNDDPVTIMVANVGPFTAMLHGLRAGDRVWLRGPFGRGFKIEGERLLLVGGGYGVAPLSFLLARALAQGCSAVAAIGARTASDLLYVDRLRSQGIDVIVTTEDGSAGQPGLVTGPLAPLLQQKRTDCLYACGPHGMLAALERFAQSHDLPAQLSWEAYMRCGIGVCGSCEHKGRVLCLDGPVLRSGALPR